jgi:hypothetical protein
MLYVPLLLYDKLLSLRPSEMSAPSMTHVRGNRFDSIRHGPEYTFTLLFIFLSPSQRRPRRLCGDLLPPPANLQDP